MAQEQPQQQVSLREVMMKLDNIMTRVPMKLQESMEQTLEARQTMLLVFNVYEQGIAEKDKKLKELEQYTRGLEELLAKSNISFLKLGEKPVEGPMVAANAPGNEPDARAPSSEQIIVPDTP